MTESLTVKKIKMLGKGRELHGFVNVWSQDGKILLLLLLLLLTNISTG